MSWTTDRPEKLFSIPGLFIIVSKVEPAALLFSWSKVIDVAFPFLLPYQRTHTRHTFYKEPGQWINIQLQFEFVLRNINMGARQVVSISKVIELAIILQIFCTAN